MYPILERIIFVSKVENSTWKHKCNNSFKFHKTLKFKIQQRHFNVARSGCTTKKPHGSSLL